MISEYDVKQVAKKREDCWFSVDENNNVINKETGETVCTVSELTQIFRKKMHCDFEVVYSCHPTLEVVYRCKECGTVIFASDDEYYDPNLKCPTCGEYKTWFKFWTADDIAKDEEKQKAIKAYEAMQREQVEADKRYFKRGRKYDWQIWSGRIKLPNRAIYLDLECDNLFRTKLKGLRLKFHWAHKDKDGMGYIYKKHFTLPLSWSALKIQIRIYKKRKNKESW